MLSYHICTVKLTIKLSDVFYFEIQRQPLNKRYFQNHQLLLTLTWGRSIKPPDKKNNTTPYKCSPRGGVTHLNKTKQSTLDVKRVIIRSEVCV